MGNVWLARHATTRKQGALKLVNADTTEDLALTERFRREVEVLATVKHPAVVALLDAGEHGDAPWLVMEYVAGDTLEARVKAGPKLPTDTALVEFACLADGLAHAHALGIHHRDIKAENVVVEPSGRMVLVDFGVALHLSQSRLTRAGNVMGTMAYLPPEVLEGGDNDPAAHDQYALGQLLYEALTQKLAFRGADGLTVKFGNLVTEKGSALDPGPELPDPIRALVKRATDPEPAERFPTMKAFAGALEAVVPKRRRADLDARLLRTVPRSRWKWGVALVVVLGLLGAFALGAVVTLAVLAFVVLR